MENQTTIFDMLYPKKKITKPIRLIELFAGYGSQALALKYLGVPFEHWKICEWAIKSIQAYKDIHFPDDNVDYSEFIDFETLVDLLYRLGISSNYNEPMKWEQIYRMGEEKIRTIYNNIYATNNLVNIQNINGEDLEIEETNKYDYILTYSFPCQDLSLAGKGKGMNDTSTRSGLLWEVERILTECKTLGELPQILLMENVPQVHSEDNLPDFNKWKDRLEELGYKNYFQDLIATDYGIPQTRNRCFMISLLGDYNYQFPPKQELKLKLKDMLEDNVDEKYYLSDAMLKHIESRMPSGDFHITTGINVGNKKSLKTAGTITTRAGNRATDNYLIENDEYDYSKEKGKIINKHLRETLEQNDKEIKDGSYIDAYNRMIREDDLSGTISTRTDAGNDTYIAIKNATSTIMGGENNGVVVLGNYSPSNHEASRIVDNNYSAPTIKENHGTINATQTNDLRIRKLTPKECFRLMGVKDEDYDKIAKNQSDSSLYHLAGDSIVVNVLMAIFKELI